MVCLTPVIIYVFLFKNICFFPKSTFECCLCRHLAAFLAVATDVQLLKMSSFSHQNPTVGFFYEVCRTFAKLRRKTDLFNGRCSVRFPEYCRRFLDIWSIQNPTNSTTSYEFLAGYHRYKPE